MISWDNLSWSYHPELPSNQINTSDSYDGFDMTGNVLLMHLNEETAIEIGNGYEDTTNLTGYWRFNENGNEESYGDHADDCTLYGDAGYDTSILRKGLNLSGNVGSYTSCGNSTDTKLGTNNFTIMLWIYTRALSSIDASNQMRFYSKSDYCVNNSNNVCICISGSSFSMYFIFHNNNFF